MSKMYQALIRADRERVGPSREYNIGSVSVESDVCEEIPAAWPEPIFSDIGTTSDLDQVECSHR
jgi:hypothetical protein